MLDAQEMRRRWSDKTVADKDSFLTSGYRTDFVYGPSSRELEIDFAHCRSIVFMDGDSTRGEDVLLIVKGSGHVTLPPGVQVRVSEGSVKLSAASAPPGQSVVGAGYRAPPPTRVSAYAGSSVSSGSASAYRTAPSEMRPRNPSPPSSSASFRAGGSHVGTYVRASRVPLPESRAGGRMEEEEDWDIDTRSVAPSDSVSSVGMKRERERSLRGGFY